MTRRPIKCWPDPVLSKTCAPVGQVDDAVRALAEDLFDTMYEAPGRGLAGPQIGVSKRIFVMDASWKDGVRAPEVFIDPEILRPGDETAEIEEACLSIPGVSAEIARPEAITATWTTLDGDRMAARLTGARARIFQHELDHLDGKVIFDRLEGDARTALEAKYKADQ